MTAPNGADYDSLNEQIKRLTKENTQLKDELIIKNRLISALNLFKNESKKCMNFMKNMMTHLHMKCSADTFHGHDYKQLNDYIQQSNDRCKEFEDNLNIISTISLPMIIVGRCYDKQTNVKTQIDDDDDGDNDNDNDDVHNSVFESPESERITNDSIENDPTNESLSAMTQVMCQFDGPFINELTTDMSVQSMNQTQTRDEFQDRRLFMCKMPNCGKSFTKNEYLGRHMRKFHKIWVSKLKNSPKGNDNVVDDGFTAAMERVGREDSSMRCPIDQCPYSTRNGPECMMRHLLTHFNKSLFKCLKCEKSFTRKETLQEHSRIHINDKMKSQIYKCPNHGCKFKVNFLNGLNTHITKCPHVNNNLNSSTTESEDRNVTSNTNERIDGTILYNALITTSSSSSRNHVKDKESEGYSNNTDDESILLNSLPLNSEASVKGFWSNRIMKRLVDLASEKQLRCSLCDFCCKKESDLNNHIQMVHSLKGKNVYQCSQCKRKFNSNNLLKAHIKVTNHCRSKSVVKKRKIILQNNGRTFKCEENGCGRTFTERRFLMEHLRRHHNMTNEMVLQNMGITSSYRCDESGCGKVFAYMQSLNRHRRRYHDLDFITSNDATVIQFPKQNPSKYLSCVKCGKEFNNESNLKRHSALAHLKPSFTKSPFARSMDSMDSFIECSQCNQQFVTEDEMNYHILSVHSQSASMPYVTELTRRTETHVYQQNNEFQRHSINESAEETILPFLSDDEIEQKPFI